MKKINLNKIGISSIGVLLAIFFVSSFGVNSASAAVTSQLGLGSKGSQVSELQQFLATNGYIYPQGIVSGYYGSLTRAAVIQFQIAYNIEPVGNVGPITRAKINNIMASGLGVDISAPALSAPIVQVVNNNATVSWNTSELARGKLIYGTSPIVLGNTFDATGVSFLEPTVLSGAIAPNDGVSRLSQTAVVNGLSPSTTYYYMIAALDPSNNVSVTVPATFHTN